MKSSKGRLVGAFAALGVAACVLFYGLSSMEGGPLSFHEGEASALDHSGSDGPGPGSAFRGDLAEWDAEGSSVAPRGGGDSRDGSAEAFAGSDRGRDGTGGAPGSSSPGPGRELADAAGLAAQGSLADGLGGGPDWARLFEQLMDREDLQRRRDEGLLPSDALGDLGARAELAELAATSIRTEELSEPEEDDKPERPRADPFAALQGRALQGILSRGNEGLALLDGRLLRVSDTLPGTSWIISAILGDRVLLILASAAPQAGDATGLGAELLLAPLKSLPPSRPEGTPTSARPAHAAATNRTATPERPADG